MAKQISSLSVVLGATVAPFVNAFTGVRSVVSSFVGQITSAGATVLKFTGIAGGIGAVLGALKGAASGITLAADLEQVGVAFETMLGSGEAAKALMADLTKFSAATPFEFPEIASSAKKLLAFGVGADQMTAKLTMLGDVSAGIGAPLEDIAAIYGKIKSRGQLTGETLNQMAERGIPIYKALAKTLGVNESQIAGMVTAGTIGFDKVDKALASLSGTGGQFSGMMAKQSQTLAGLWSTLTDNVGLTMAGLVTTVVDAFSLRNALKALTEGIGTAGGIITDFVGRVAPIVVGFAGKVWTAIATTFNAIYATVAPIVGQITNWISANWSAIVASTTGFAMSVWSVISSTFTAVRDIVSAIGEGVVAAWNWACETFGIATVNAGSTVSSVFATIGQWAMWLQQTLTTCLQAAAFYIQHWRDVVEYVGANTAAAVVTIGNTFAYYFGDVIPAYVSWFADNFVNLLTDAFEFGLTVAKNFGKNVVAIISNLPGLIAGTTDWSEVWTPITDGFVAQTKALPQIADRIPGDIEQALYARSDELGASLSTGLGEHLSKAAQDAKGAGKQIADGISDTLDKITAPKIEVPTPTIPTPTMTVNAQPAIDGIDKATKKAHDDMKLVVAGSGEAMQMAAQAEFEATVSKIALATAPVTAAPVSKIASTVGTVATSSTPAAASPSTTPAPTAQVAAAVPAPVPAAVKADLQSAAAKNQKDTTLDQVLGVLKAMLDEVRRGGFVVQEA
ncbi:MAG: tape measure protein [Tepidisphaeraceae bacterium]